MSVTFSDLFAMRRRVSASPLKVAARPANSILTAQDHVLVPKSVFDGRDESPDTLIKAVGDHVEIMTKRAFYEREELSDMAIRVCECESYLRDITQHGHAVYLRQIREDVEPRLASVLFGLKTIGARDHLALARRMSHWVLDHADDIANGAAFRNGLARTLDALDAPFAELEAQSPLKRHICDWIASHSALRVIPDEEFLPLRDKVANANPTKPLREAAQQIDRLNKMLTARPHAGISLTAGAQRTPQPLVAVGNQSQVQIDGRLADAFAVHTTGGAGWCVLTEGGVALHERLAKDPDTTDKDALPCVGECLATVSSAQITEAASVARQLNVGAAVHFLLQQVSQKMTVDYITIRSFGPDKAGTVGISLLLVLNRASAAMSVVVTEKDAVLLAEPSHEKIAALSSDMIRDYARRIRTDAVA